jgi:hypothetical protein
MALLVELLIEAERLFSIAAIGDDRFRPPAFKMMAAKRVQSRSAMSSDAPLNRMKAPVPITRNRGFRVLISAASKRLNGRWF